ncbi:REP-associated tyrosine transposase [Rhodocyclaceae bacterium SMB388]
MARPLRIEFPGALYHVMSRGDRREDIFWDDGDRTIFLDTLGDVVSRFNWQCHAYCLMDNHYHLMVATPDGNLSKGMRHLNGVFTQVTNRRHRRSGHVFQGRYKAILVDGDNYLLELARYIVLNPVRARIVASAADYPWSSYRATVGMTDPPPWLTTDTLLSVYGPSRCEARAAFIRFVDDAMDVGAGGLSQQVARSIFLGDESFIKLTLARMGEMKEDFDIPKVQRRAPPPTLERIAQAHADRDAAMVAAHATGEYSYAEIARYFGVHFTTVGRAVRRALRAKGRS